ncbi:MAG: hypothetical protein FJ216_07140 [Ignavibacteria bacterium]|nr:hypothetical protein [Ignavibacteria bacterium]
MSANNYNPCKEDYEFQVFPKSGILFTNMNKNLRNIKDILNKEADENEINLRTYLLSSIQLNDKKFIQNGCAPNWQGNYITLCTCKHMMRTAEENPENWENKWIAGLLYKDENSAYLVYLMKIKKAFESMFDLWKNLDEDTKISKSARKNKFGDLFEPKIDKIDIKDIESQVNPCNYYPPCNEHVHIHSWYFDIHSYYNGKYSVYLLGNNENSFIYNEKMIVVNHPERKKFTQGAYGKKWTSNKFIENIELEK